MAGEPRQRDRFPDHFFHFYQQPPRSGITEQKELIKSDLQKTTRRFVQVFHERDVEENAK